MIIRLLLMNVEDECDETVQLVVILLSDVVLHLTLSPVSIVH